MIIRHTYFWCDKSFLQQLFWQVDLHSVANLEFINVCFDKV